jgi:uncharacterized surface protein with fasciclin (FAS1) repeats
MHLLNKLMHPPQSFVKPRRTFIDALRERPGYKVFSTLLVDTGIDEYLRRPVPLTLFAPSDEAFGKTAGLAELLKDDKQLRSLLYRHICAGRFDLRALGKIARLRNSDGVNEQTRAHMSLIQDARIVEADIRAWNGYVHGIDKVLLKESSSWSLQACFSYHISPYAEPSQSVERPTQTKLLERAILRGMKS